MADIVGAFGRGFQIGTMVHERTKERRLERLQNDAAAKGRSEFDEGVKSGKYKPDDVEAKLRIQMRNRISALADQGYVEDASKLAEVMDGQNGKKVARYARAALQFAAAGDEKNALHQVASMYSVPGWGPDGYNFKIGDLNEQDGKKGYSIDITGPGGDTSSHFLPAGRDTLIAVSNLIDPESAVKFSQSQAAHDRALAEWKYKTDYEDKQQRGRIGVQNENALTKLGLEQGFTEGRDAAQRAEAASRPLSYKDAYNLAAQDPKFLSASQAEQDAVVRNIQERAAAMPGARPQRPPGAAPAQVSQPIDKGFIRGKPLPGALQR